MVNLSDLSSSDSDGSDDSGSDLGEGTSASGSAYRGGGPSDARSLESMDVTGKQGCPFQPRQPVQP